MNIAFLAALGAVGQSYVVVHVSVVPMDREVILSDQTVVVSGSKIVSLGSYRNVKIPSNSTIINGKGKYLIPGLIDIDVQIRSINEMPLYLANGVTTVLNQDGKSAHIGWRSKVRSGVISGPNIFTCGPKIYRSRSATDAVSTVDAQAKAGFDSIFVNMSVSATC
jgi:imidazolonepropionase-like amidohydrolase